MPKKQSNQYNAIVPKIRRGPSTYVPATKTTTETIKLHLINSFSFFNFSVYMYLYQCNYKEGSYLMVKNFKIAPDPLSFDWIRSTNLRTSDKVTLSFQLYVKSCSPMAGFSPISKSLSVITDAFSPSALTNTST